jgi:3-phosphoshikimate 1-carboxyvinyltransferase
MQQARCGRRIPGVASIEIKPVAGPVRAVAVPPGSKSLTNRALVCAALAEGPSELSNVLDSEDTRVMVESLGRLGIELSADWPGKSIRVSGCGGRIPAKGAELFVANSGTTMRFLTAVAALAEGTFRLDGTARMRERPIRDLLDALAQIGVHAKSESGNGCPPVVIQAKGLPGGRATIRGNVSSQFLSGLLMAAPRAQAPLELKIEGELVSLPYVRMTLRVMQAFGVSVDSVPASPLRPPETFYIDSTRYGGRRFEIEPDASAASYFWAAAAITGGQVTVKDLSRSSLQGDVRFCECLAQMGCGVEYANDSITVVGKPLSGIDVDMNDISDTVQTLSAVALFARGQTTIRGVAHIRHKETDRIHALAVELRKFGAKVDERPDGLLIEPPRDLHGATIDTYDDHRMAMSMALVGLRVGGVVINDPGCTAKTYPDFFADLEAIAK